MNESFFSLLYRHTILALHTVLYCVAVPVLVLLHRFYRLSVMCDFGFHFISHEYGFFCVVLAEAGGTDKADVTSFFFCCCCQLWNLFFLSPLTPNCYPRVSIFSVGTSFLPPFSPTTTHILTGGIAGGVRSLRMGSVVCPRAKVNFCHCMSELFFCSRY